MRSLKNTRFYSGGYINSNNNYVIINNSIEESEEYKYSPTYAVLKNILLRSNVIKPSMHLQKKLKLEKTQEKILLVDEKAVDWSTTIKGSNSRNLYPAHDLFYNFLPEQLGNYSFVMQLIVPEYKIEDIIEECSNEFIDQRVDFYIPDLKMVIEVDGSQHELDKVIKINDLERDNYLKKHNITVERVSSKDVCKDSFRIKRLSQKIIKYINENSHLKNYLNYCETEKEDIIEENIFKYNSIHRLQITILDLLLSQRLDINSEEWSLNIINNDAINYELIAIKDLFYWLKLLFNLRGIKIEMPIINIINDENRSDILTIDISLKKRWNYDDLKQQKIIVRTCYDNLRNNFITSISDPIKYNIRLSEDSKCIPIMKTLLKEIFGFANFRPGQIPSIINVLNGQDTVGLLPTGAGKSLIYQFSVLLQPAVSYIVVPIISLMEDQVHNIKSFGIKNIKQISSNQSSKEKIKVVKDFSKGKYQMIFISPERFQSLDFRNSLAKVNKKFLVAIAVIDEIHCLSEWGHDFRVSYLNLSKNIRNTSPAALILGLTATASVNVLQDLKAELQIDNSNIKTMPNFTREELSFEVITPNNSNYYPKRKPLDSIIDEIYRDKNIKNIGKTDGVLIFTRFKNGPKGCFDISNYLNNSQKLEIKSKCYFGGSPPKNSNIENPKQYKSNIQKIFKESKFPILVATKAFGMGVDKPNIRYTIHYGIPESLEALYQEAGRAGRDGKDSKCYVLFSPEENRDSQLEKIFNLNTPVKKVREIVDKVSFNGNDIFGNLFLWTRNLTGYQTQRDNIMKIKNYINEKEKLGKKNILIQFKKLNIKKTYAEKALYRLSIMGIVNDWTINRWSEYNFVASIQINRISIEKIGENVLKYIKKYDIEFKYGVKSPKYYFDYCAIYNNKSLSKFERITQTLLVWQYENIIHSKKESMKTVYNQCKNFKNSSDFKRYIENYFRFDDKTYSYEYFIERPLDYKEWFQIFYDKEGELLSKDEVFNQIPVIRRYLESFSKNTAFNFLSGVMHLIQDTFSHSDGEDRLAFSYKNIKILETKKQEEILDLTLELISEYNMAIKNNYSKFILTSHKPNKPNKLSKKLVYKILKDEYSLSLILSEANKKIKKIRREIDEY